VEFLAPAGLSTEAEAAPLDLAKLIRQARSTGIKAFLENMSDPGWFSASLKRPASAWVERSMWMRCRPQMAPLRYIAMFRHNVPMMREAMLKNRIAANP
jgi:zinc/manganese transport system substrate-binding protein